MECARCHDHKYDPVKQKEYYQLSRFFNSVNETGQIPYSRHAQPDARARATTPAREAGGAAHATARSDGGRRRRRALDARVRGLAGADGRAPRRRPRIDVQGLVAHLPLDGGVKVRVPEASRRKPTPELIFANTLGHPGEPARRQGSRAPDGRRTRRQGPAPRRGRPHRAAAGRSRLLRPTIGGWGIRAEPAVLVALWFRLEKARRGAAADALRRALRRQPRLRDPPARGRHVRAGLHHVFPDNSLEIETRAPVAPGAWHHVALTYDGSSRASGLV